MITDFMNNAQAAIQDSVRALEDEIRDDFNTEFLKNIDSAKGNIYALYESTLSQLLGKELVANAFYAPSLQPVLEKFFPQAENETASSSSPFTLAIGIGMIMTPLIRRVMTRVGVTATAKIGGKLLARVLPVLGWALLVWEGVSIYYAKTNFEEELRKNFFAEYKQSLTAETIWTEEGVADDSSFEKTTQDLVKNFCAEVEAQCRNTAVALTEVADVIKQNPILLESVKNKRDDGIDPTSIYDTMKQLYSVFKENFASADSLDNLQRLEQIYNRIPFDFRGPFTRLADVAGPELIALFSKDRTAFDTVITKAQLIGVDHYLQHRSDADKMDSALFTNTFTPYASFIATDKDACDGVFLLVNSGLQATGWQQEALRRVATHAEVFTAISTRMRDNYDKLAEIFQSERRLVAFLAAYGKEPALSVTAIQSQPIAFWDAGDADEIEKTLSLAAYLEQTWDVSPEEAVDTAVNDTKLRGIYEEHGAEGIDIWRRFAGKDSGAQQEKNAESAIRLVSRGFEADKLMTVGNVRSAERLDKIPLGLFLFNTAGPMLSFVFFVLIILIIITLVAYFAYKILGFHRKSHQAGTDNDSSEGSDENAEGSNSDSDD